MIEWDKNRSKQMFKNKIVAVKSTLAKIFTNNTSLKVKQRSNKTTNKFNNNEGDVLPMIRSNQATNNQKLLRSLLKEFNLQQYTKKFYELGYDDDNIFKICLLTSGDKQELFRNLKVFPGHSYKMNQFIDRVNEMFAKKGSFKQTNLKNITNNKRFYSVTARNEENYNFTKVNYNTKPKSVETIRNNNKLLKSFVKGGFGFNYYLNDNAEKDTQANSSKINNSNTNYSNQNLSSPNVRWNNNNIVAYRDDSFMKENVKEEEINNEIDKLLNYYMSQLNEKIDKSYDEFDDEDDEECLNDEEIKNMIKSQDININNKNKLPAIKKKVEHENISGIEQTKTHSKIFPNKDDSKLFKKSENDKTNKSFLNPAPINENINAEKNNQSLARVVSSKSREKSARSQNSAMSILNKTNPSNLSLKPGDTNNINNTNSENSSSIIPKKLENNNSNVIINERKLVSPLKEKKEENENDISCRSVGSIKTPNNKEKVEQSPKNLLNDLSSEASTKINALNIQPIVYRYTNPKSIKVNKDEEFSEIRVVKSCEDKELRQNFEQFDIEYMCRCLGLALMKHIESAKDKHHILDLINIKEKFDFFNSVFNLNFDFFNSFLNLQNKISNLDKLDEYYKLNENCVGINSKEMQFIKDCDVKKNEPLVSIYSHINYGNEITNDKYNKVVEVKKNTDNINAKVESIIFTHNNNNLNTEKYKNVGNQAKTILNQDLTAINEVDSMEFIQNNLLFTVDQKNKKQPSQFIDLLQESATNFLAEKDEKQLQKNSDVINEQNEEYDDFQEEENDLENKLKNETNLNKNGNTMEKQSEEGVTNNKFSTLKNDEEQFSPEFNKKIEENKELINEEINETLPQRDDMFESGMIESNYIIDIKDAEKLTTFLLKSCEIYDDDYIYSQNRILHKRYIQPPDPSSIYEFCANIMIMTKMEKEVIMISLIYLERFIFNTGVLLNSRNWKRLLFTAMAIASKIWDDDSFENNHFAQVFTHLKIGEINLLERTFLELINYKVFVKCSEYFKYFFIIKSIALKYNFNGFNLVPISVEKMMKLQESAFLKQKKLKKQYSTNNSTIF